MGILNRKKPTPAFFRSASVENGRGAISVSRMSDSRQSFYGDIEKAKTYAASLLEFHTEVIAAIHEASRLEGAVASLYPVKG